MVLITEHIDVCCGALFADDNDDSENNYTKLKCASLIKLEEIENANYN